MKKRLEFITLTSSAMKQKHKKKVLKLQSKINYQNLHKIKYLNQEINRRKLSNQKKDNKIKQLKLQLSETALAKELTKTKQKLKNVTRNYKRSINVNRSQSFSQAACSSKEDKEWLNLQEDLKVKNATIIDLENKILCLEEKIESSNSENNLQKEGKMYSSEMRMFVYDAVVNHVPTKNVPILIKKFAKRSGITMDKVPHRNMVEMMTTELGVISDFQTAEILIEIKT
ncbi:hypothetical protein SNE40_007853 [Patella caerulea]|uniref:Uncharacterized protein n=1 Tax=Patella caerulea TaxID=87958 RepID=A0AAN8JUJ5_PATCE